MAVNGEKVRMNLLRICACGTAIINTIHLPPVFVQNRVTCKEKQQQMVKQFWMKLLGICACATAIISTNHLLSVFVQNRVTCKEKQWQ